MGGVGDLDGLVVGWDVEQLSGLIVGWGGWVAAGVSQASGRD